MNPRGPGVTLGLALAGLALAGCATARYEVDSVGAALADGRAAEALALVDARLAHADPATQILLQLERAILRAHAGDLAGAARDLAEADPALEVLDLDRDLDGQLTAALLSEAGGEYRPPAFEKLMLNALGMAIRLAAGDLAGARVEARRFGLLERYYESTEGAAGLHANEAPGATALGRWLAARLDDAPPPPDHGELVIIVVAGRVPARGVTTIGRADAMRRAGQVPTPADETRTLRVLGLTAERAAEVALVVDDAPVAAALVADVSASARLAFARVEPRLLAGAVSRDTVRLATEKAGTRGTGSSFLGAVLGVTVASQDTPDTRAWTLLPARVAVARVEAAPGGHAVRAGAVEREVEVPAGGRAVVLLTLP